MSPKVTKESEAAANPGDGIAAVNGKVPTAGEVKFAFTLLSNVKGKPDFNWDKVAEILGLTRKSAGERWRLFRHKFGINLNEENGNNQTTGPKDTKKGVKAAKAANGNGEDNNENGDADANNDTTKEESAPVTPAKAKRVRKKPAAAGNNNTNSTTTTPASTVGKKRGAAAAAIAAAALAAGGHDSNMDESESPTKKTKGAATAGSAESSPLSSVPAMTGDEGSATETEV